MTTLVQAQPKVEHANESNFDQLVLRSDSPALVDFYADWCGPCRMLSPVIEDLSGDYEGKVVFAKMNTDECPSTPGQYGIMSIPSLLIFKDGEVVDTLRGAYPKSQLAAWIGGAVDGVA